MLNVNKIAAHLESIQRHSDLTNDEMGDTLGVSGSYVSLLKRGERKMSEKLFDRFCEVYNLDPNSFYCNKSETTTNVSDSISEIMRIKKLELEDLSDVTGISVLELSQIVRGKMNPTDDHIKILSRAFDLKPEILEQGRVCRAFTTIRRELESLNFSKKVIEDYMKALEREIK